MRAIDRVLPAHDTRLGRGTIVSAPATNVYGVVLTMDLVGALRNDPVARLVLALRTVPDALARRFAHRERRSPLPSRLVVGELPERGEWVRLAAEPEREIVFGAIGSFWAPAIEWREIQAAEFMGSWTPGYGKIAIALRVDPADHGRTILRCELRTVAPDPVTGLRFKRRWRVARVGAWLVAGRLLRAIRREAEHHGAAEHTRAALV